MTYTNNAITVSSFREAQKLYPGAILHRDHPENWPDGPWTVVEPEVYVPTLEQVLAQKQAEARATAEESYRQTVVDADGNTWNGGFDSAQAIKAAADMAEFVGVSELSVFDSSNVEHVVTIGEAKTIAATIGMDYQAKFAAKQAAMRQLTETYSALVDAGADSWPDESESE